MEAIAAGKHVVTANKALLAVHGTEIFAAAQAKGVMVAFEAAVAGGIPIIKALREGLTANSIQWVAGIINGTTNFILSEMRDKGLDFGDVLKEAQRLGYAEADPTFDIEGIDAAHKVSIMSAIAFGIPMQFDKAYIEGITKLAATDIKYAEQLGYRIKLLGIAKKTSSGVELRVHPTLIPLEHPLAAVRGAYNAVFVEAESAGQLMFYGAGAGGSETASAILGDLVSAAKRHVAGGPGLADSVHANLAILPIDRAYTRYQISLEVTDQPGILAKIANVFADHGVSIETVEQSVRQSGGKRRSTATLEVGTHVATDASLSSVVAALAANAAVESITSVIRVEGI